MKESAGVSGSGGQTQGSGSGSGRSASDKEKTKLRERQRRSITTKIFHGLRKHGGYHLSPRADINDVLRQLAKEAGWVIEPDGTTYRPTTTTQASNCCAVCGAGKRSGTPTPTSSFVGGAECSATASPCRFPIGDPLLGVVVGPTPPYLTSGGSGVSLSSSSSQDLTSDRDVPLALYVNMYGRLAGGLHPSAAAVGPSAMAAAYQQQMYLQEVRASNQSTPVRSPQRRA